MKFHLFIGLFILNILIEKRSNNVKLSFVIIGKNEANNIEKCIFSIVNNCNLKDYEIIFIDSNSSDNTLEILKRKEFS
ncbi:glycosyltransferase, partial [Clostridium perfringens]|uniref:glycosyltransferase n=1 Tax=Clostridium perfringens TaxID=1502 RepID=UPI003D7C73AE